MEFLLRPWRLEDWTSVARNANNQKIADNLRDVFPFPYTEQDAKDYMAFCIGTQESQALLRAIEVDGQAVGSIGLMLGTDVYRQSAELGYWLAEPYWGKGIMSRAAHQLCAEGFARWDIVRIFAEPFAYNTGSRKVLEKAGFVLEGVMHRGVVKNGKILDYCMYAQWKEE